MAVVFVALQSRFADGIHGGHIEERAVLVVSKIDDAVGAFLVRWAALLIDRVVAFGFSVCDKEASVGKLEKLCKDSVVHAVTANLVFEDTMDAVEPI